VLIAVTDHAAERYRQRIGSTSGAVDVKPEIARRVAAAIDAGRLEELERGNARVHDLRDRSLIFVCRREGAELIVVTLWERDDGVTEPRVPRRFTDALRRDDPDRRDDRQR